MWGNLSGVVGAAIQKVQKIQTEIESQMDHAVGVDASGTGVNLSSASDDRQRNKLDSSPTPMASESAESVCAKREETDIPEIRSSSNGDQSSRSRSQSPLVSDSPTDLFVTRQAHEEAMKDMKAKAIEKLRAKDAKFADERSALANALEHERLLRQQESALAAKQAENLKQQIEQQLSRLRDDFERERKQFSDDLAESEAKHRQSLAERQAEHDRQLELQSLSFAAKLQQEVQSKLAAVETISEVDHEHREQESSQAQEYQQSLEKSLESMREKLKQQDYDFSQRENAYKSEQRDAAMQLQHLQAENSSQSQQLSQLEVSLGQLRDELSRAREVISERERALEASVSKCAEMIATLESNAQRISDLQGEIAAKDSQLRQQQLSTVADSELRVQLSKLQESLKEKDSRLAAFQEEGQLLARKQSDMEKNVRKSKQEVREKDAEIAKLKESKDQLTKVIEQTQDALKKNELDALGTSKTLSAMQAVSQASADRLSSLESELSSKQEELISQRRALESAWSDANELKRAITELKAERDDMRRQLGEGTSRVMETETTRREAEQREAVLRATSRQLQDSLQAQMRDSSQREERLREELSEMRRKWQDAVFSRESQTNEMSQATSPLLKHITTLQETLRIKSEQWTTIESSLTERLMRAENAAESFDHKKAMLEDQITNLKQQLTTATQRLGDAQQGLQSAEIVLDRLKRLEIGWIEEKNELVSKLSLETAQKNSLQTSLREMEVRHKLELQDSTEKLNVQLSQVDLECSRLKRDFDRVQQELDSQRQSQRDQKRSLQTSRRDGAIANSDDSKYPLLSPTLPSGEMSFVANEKLQVRSKLRDEELLASQAQLHQLQVARNALLDEVSFLSARNAQLEDATQRLPQIQSDLDTTKKQLELVLILLGEKEEELEACQQDMKEVKLMYSEHMNELVEKMALSGPDTLSSLPKSPEHQSEGSSPDRAKNAMKFSGVRSDAMHSPTKL